MPILYKHTSYYYKIFYYIFLYKRVLGNVFYSLLPPRMKTEQTKKLTEVCSHLKSIK